jgi:hypothetical protein
MDACTFDIDSEGRKSLLAQRNDPLMNEYHPIFSTAWRANTDVTIMPDNHAVLAYISKYVSKAEKPSAAFTDVLDLIANRLDADTPAQVVVQKCLSKLLTERDWSAQEVSHLLMGTDVHRKSRTVVGLCVSENRQRRLVSDDPQQAQMESTTSETIVAPGEDGEGVEDEADGEVVECSDWIDAYTKRPVALEHLSLYLWFMRYRKGRTDTEPVCLRKRRVVKIWPQPIRGDDKDSAQYQDWCRVKVLLHHPHRNPFTLDLLEEGLQWSDAYDACTLMCTHNTNDTLPRRRPRPRKDVDDFEDISQESLREYDDAAFLAGIGPRAHDDDIDYNEWGDLGTRDIDICHDWMSDADAWTVHGLRERMAYLEGAKGTVRGLSHQVRLPNHSARCLMNAQLELTRLL